jgi:hypothetical protein
MQYWVFISSSGHLKARLSYFDHWWATSLHPLSNVTVILICSDLCICHAGSVHFVYHKLTVVLGVVDRVRFCEKGRKSLYLLPFRSTCCFLAF